MQRIIVLVATLLTLCPIYGDAASTAFVDVNVVDVISGRVKPNQTVVVTDGRIVRVSSAKSARVPAGAVTVDGKGRYLAPGLMDMHSHAMSEDDLLFSVATGVTSIRQMFGDPQYVKWRDAIATGTMVGPRMKVGSLIVDGRPQIWPALFSLEMTDPAAADAWVAGQKAAGYEFIKIYSRLSREMFEAIIAAGKKHGIEVSGHIPQAVPFMRAVESGMRTSRRHPFFSSAGV